jgi:hypothetical protein
MKQNTILRDLSCWAGLLLFALAPASGAAGRAAQFEVQEVAAARRFDISFSGQRVMSCEMDPQRHKPYVSWLSAPGRNNVLRDAPSDHLHHHALMYAIKVNGVNFWEEPAGAGVQKVVDAPAPVLSITPQGLPKAVLTQSIHWLEPDFAFLPDSEAHALLVETRTLTLVLDPARNETALHWQSQFAVGGRTNTVVLTGANYHGLGVRFAEELDAFALHFTASQKPDLSNHRQDTSIFPWEAVSFSKPGSPATLAMFGHPKNARGDARFFAMKTAFPYLAATQSLDREPLTYRKGDKFELNYLVAVYPEIKTAEALEARCKEWLSQPPR